MNLSLVHCHISGFFLEYAFVLLLEYLDQIIIDLCVHMADLTIVHMLAYRLLFPVHHSIGYTGVIWVKLEPTCDQGLAKLLVVKQAFHHHSIDDINTCQY